MSKQNAINTARAWLAQDPLIIDTETTGLDEGAEVCDLAIIDANGRVLFNQLVKPTKGIPAAASRVHGIDNTMVDFAPTIDRILPQVIGLLAGRLVLTYNAEFDIRIIEQSIRIGLGFSVPLFGEGHVVTVQPGVHVMTGAEVKNQARSACIMHAYAEFADLRDRFHGDYKWHKLGTAAAQCGIRPQAASLHRALYDAELARQVLLYMAGQEERES